MTDSPSTRSAAFTHSTHSRRTVLRTTGVSLAVGLAGCSGVLGGGGGSGGGAATPTPTDVDKGRDSYGVLVRNERRTDQEVTVEVKRPFEEETYLDETVTVEARSTHEWDQVMTEEVEYSIVGRVPVEVEEIDRTESEYSTWVTVGDEDTPPAANVLVQVDTIDFRPNGSDETYEIPRVVVFWPEEYRDY